MTPEEEDHCGEEFVSTTLKTSPEEEQDEFIARGGTMLSSPCKYNKIKITGDEEGYSYR